MNDAIRKEQEKLVEQLDAMTPYNRKCALEEIAKWIDEHIKNKGKANPQ